MIRKKLKNITTALNVLYAKKEKISPAYVLIHNSNREKQVILSMIPNGEKREADFKGGEAKSEWRPRWHYLTVKKLLALLRWIASKH